ncbi:MAG TPA: hypothetical protein DEF51_09325 [Myxococcales bacterium]|nr:hypothetical protein [Myxococcales bacterium]
MGGVSVEGGHGGKKSVDSEIPLVPFIDLLLCCIMFLLVTAVWNKLARIETNQQQPGQNAPMDQPQEEQIRLFVHVSPTGYGLSDTAGVRIQIDKAGDVYDQEGLREKLRDRRQQEPNRRDLIVTADDGVVYEDIVSAMDIVVGEGYEDMSLTPPQM